MVNVPWTYIMKNLIGDESGKVLQKRIVKDKTKRLQD